MARSSLPTSVEEQLSEVGMARVLVSLAPGAGDDLQAELASSLPPLPPGLQAQFASLAALAAHAAGLRQVPRNRRQVPQLRVFSRLGLALGFIDPAGAEKLREDRRVTEIGPAPELSLIRPVVAASESPPPQGATWGIRRLRVPALWAAGLTGADVRVGHLDTGVDGSHPALAEAIGDYAAFDLAGNEVRRAEPGDPDGHGTHTAGTILGRPGAKGAIGVAPGARLFSAQVIEGGDVVARVLAGLEWALSRDVQVISMSLGLRGYTPAFQRVVNAVRRAGVLQVYAIGNEGPGTSRSPGNYDTILSVGATDAGDAVADFSSSFTFNRALRPIVPALVAPGVQVLSAAPGGGFALMSGTSMATPHIAGLAALLLEARPGASVADLERALLAACARPGPMPEHRTGEGIPDGTEAYRRLTGAEPPAPPPSGRFPGLPPRLGRLVRGELGLGAARAAAVPARGRPPARAGSRRRSGA